MFPVKHCKGVVGGWMPRKGMNNPDKSGQLRRLTGTLSPRFSAGYKPLLSNLSGAPPSRKMKAPATLAGDARAEISIAAEIDCDPTFNRRAAQ